MQEYTSKQHQILRPAEQIYAVISRFDNLTPAVADRVEEWQATEDTCSFKAKGFTVRLRMEEREAPKHVNDSFPPALYHHTRHRQVPAKSRENGS